MSVLDFLFEGTPPKAVTTYGQTVDNLPKWLSDYTQDVISRVNAVGSEPYQTYGGPRVADLTADQKKANSMVRGSVGSYLPYVNNAGSSYGAAGDAARGVLDGPTGMSAAQPYLQSAGRTFPGEAASYVNPYIDNVINLATSDAERALTERFLPQAEWAFGGSGHDTRSTDYQKNVRNGIRDITEGLHEQALAARAGAWESGANIFSSDANRMSALASLTGNLQNAGNAINLSAANTIAGLGDRQSALGSLLQQLQRGDAAAVDAIGTRDQMLNQRGYDTAYQDWQNQRDYPRQNLDWMLGALEGLPHERAVETTTSGPGSIYGPSPAATLGSAGLSILSLLSNSGPASAPHSEAQRLGYDGDWDPRFQEYLRSIV